MTVPPHAPGAARRLGTAALLAAALLAACRPAVPSATLSRAPAIPERVTPAFPDGWRFTPGRDATFGEHGMVSSATRLASDAGTISRRCRSGCCWSRSRCRCWPWPSACSG